MKPPSKGNKMRHTPVGFKGHGGVSPPPPPPPPIADLGTAIAATPPGGTLVVPAGTYPSVGLQDVTKSPHINVTCDPGVVINGMLLKSCSGIKLQGAEIIKDAVQQVCVIFQSGSDNSLVNCKLHGAAVGDGLGVRLLESATALVNTCEFYDLGGGIAVVGSNGSSVTANDFHDLEIDAIQCLNSSQLLIDHNTFDAFFPQTGDHSDCIQFLTFGQTVPAIDLTITNNTYLRTRGLANTQGVFMGNEADIFYDNVTITGNAFMGTVFHGITVAEATTVNIDHNLVQSYTDTPSIVAWIEDDLCTSGSVNNNTTTALNPVGPTPLPRSGNIIVSPCALAAAPALLAAWRAG